ncbi:hypothetical protein SAMN04488009_1920 [Maribacter sedimenticola]|uniref:Transposase n=1 Tax=Maribacter sedimenticola TaxID=228956 RepID=A0ABY1SGK7_9FLAO|nr:hypothetical protein SAMN04488009_1920 [Maribacter sedimenticola]
MKYNYGSISNGAEQFVSKILGIDYHIKPKKKPANCLQAFIFNMKCYYFKASKSFSATNSDEAGF